MRFLFLNTSNNKWSEITELINLMQCLRFRVINLKKKRKKKQANILIYYTTCFFNLLLVHNIYWNLFDKLKYFEKGDSFY